MLPLFWRCILGTAGESRVRVAHFLAFDSMRAGRGLEQSDGEQLCWASSLCQVFIIIPLPQKRVDFTRQKGGRLLGKANKKRVTRCKGTRLPVSDFRPELLSRACYIGIRPAGWLGWGVGGGAVSSKQKVKPRSYSTLAATSSLYCTSFT